MPRTGSLIAYAVIFSLLQGACAADGFAPDGDAAASLARLPSLGEAIVVEDGFQTPESAVHDDRADVYLVSNVAGHPQDLNDGGFISRIAPDGTVLDLRWIEGGANGVTLHAPKGLVIVGDVLYVADADAVRLFDRRTGAHLETWPVPVTVENGRVQGVVLNGVCAGPRGEVYLTATGITITDALEVVPSGQDAVYRFVNGSPVAIAEGPELMGPNGCWVVGANVFVVPLLGNEPYRLSPSGRRSTVASLPAGGLDGLVGSGGFLYVGSIFEGVVMRMSTGGSQVVTVLEGLVSPADLGYDQKRHRLLIPSLFGDFVTIQPLR